ncbi:MAG: DUF3574 domain-containing protein [Rubrobacteraceae bacterium]|jgi:hypothetical protein|nr:DUF3574 domain-containing protein [Rubrobacteraceae bacterium]
MKKISDKATWNGRAKVFAVGLAVALALTLAAVAAALNPEVESVSAQAPEPSANGQESVDASRQKPVGKPFKRTELYFGSEKPDGTEVTEAEFEQFVDEEVTPSFPDSLTILTGEGQFRGADGVIVEERSFVLILLYPPSDKKANGEIEEVREDYKSEFQQESVLRADSRDRVSF